jgi:hypothetical protein
MARLDMRTENSLLVLATIARIEGFDVSSDSAASSLRTDDDDKVMRAEKRNLNGQRTDNEF